MQDVSINDLSPLEIEYLQREAVTRLQAMDIAVSHGILKGLSARGVFQRLSSNSQARRKISDKGEQLLRNVEIETHIVTCFEHTELHAVFGQPLEVLVGSSPRPVMTPNMHSASSTPALLNLEKQVHPPSPSSPTRMTDSPPDELNVTTNSTTSVSFDPSSVASPPSPCTLRRQVLTPLGQQVPTIVRKAIEHLDSNGVKLEGLFRIPGSKARMAEVTAYVVCVCVCMLCVCGDVCCACVCVFVHVCVLCMCMCVFVHVCCACVCVFVHVCVCRWVWVV